MLKRILCFSLAVILAVSGMFTSFIHKSVASAAEINWAEIFTISYNGTNKRYDVKTKTGWPSALANALGDSTTLEFPETYNDGANGEAPFYLLTTVLSNTDSPTNNFPNITSIVFNESQVAHGAGILYRFPNLETVTFKGDKLMLPSAIAYSTKTYKENDASTYASKLKTVYINGDVISKFGANVFEKVNTQIKIYVTNQNAKDFIITNAGQESNANIIKEDQIVVQPLKQNSSITIACEDIYAGTEGGFKPTATIEGDQNAEIEYTLYTDEECTKKSSKYYNSSSLPIGTYYLRALMKSTETHNMAYSNVLKVQVKENEPTDKTALNAAIEAAEKFQEDNKYNQQNFDQTAWKNVFDRGTLDKAKEISADTENRYSQEKVDEATKNLNDTLDALKKSVADNTEAWNKLQDLIKKAEGIVANDKDKYTEESWTKENLQARIDEAKALKKDDATTTVREIERNISVIQNSIDGLKLKDKEPDVKPGEPFAFIKKGSQVKVLSMTASEKLVGATKVRVTFRCAEDVSFNTNASIDIDPVIAGTSNYLQIKGTGDYTTGATYTVEVPLSAAIKAGDSIEIIMTTFSWDDAKDYAYGVTAIEFVDANDKALGSYIDADVYKENLATAIKEAEAINTSTYTAESVEKLTKALEAAKALKEDATAEEMKKAIDAINDAIKGLTKKDEEEEAREKLAAKIKEAEAIDTSLYTPESVEKLTKALEAAKALKEDASEEEINKVLAAIDEAIKGLVKKGGTGNDTPQTPKPITKVIGVAQGKTFTAGNFVYKVSAAATITGTVKKAGKVTVTGLSKTGKKKSSINVKNAVSASGASYQVTGIGSKAFRKAAKLKKVTLGTSVKSIPTSAFENCKKLTSVKATGVTKIGAKAFKGCKVLAKLTFGKKKVSSVKKGAFKGCKKTIKVAGGSKKVKKGNVKKLKKSGYKKFK